MTPQPKKKFDVLKLITAVGSSLAASCLFKLVIMFGSFHDDIIRLQKDGEARDKDAQGMHVGINELRLGQYDMNGRLKSVETLLMESNLSQKKNTN